MAGIVDLSVPPELKKPVKLVVDASTSLEGELEVEVFKTPEEKLKDPEVEIVKDAVLKKFDIEFTPPSPDEYTFVVKHKGEEVSGSPLKLNLSKPDYKKVVLTQPPTGKIKAGQSINILFDTFAAGRGELTGVCKGEASGEIPVLVSRKGITSTFKVTFLPPQEDEYSLSVCFAGKNLKGSPYKIDMIPVNPSKVRSSKPTIPDDPSQPITMDICTEGAGNAQLKAKCKGEDSGNVHVDVKKLSKTDYHLTLKPPKRDKLTLSVLYGGKHIKDSPFEIITKSQPELIKVGELHIPDEAGSGEDVWVEIDCTEAGKDDLSAECKGQTKIPVDIEEFEPMKYRVKFTPALPDVYVLTVLYGDVLIPGGTFDINLLPKSNSKLVKHLGTFIPDDHAAPVMLKFDASEAGQGEMRARVNGILMAGPVDSEVRCVDESTKEYEISFHPSGADTYNVDVYWSNETIPGSPIYVKIVYPNEVLVSDPVDTPKLLQPISVHVDTQYAGPGVLSASCSGKETGDIDVEIIQDEADNTKYDVSFRPIEPDSYALRLYFNDIEIKYSPVEVEIEPVEETVEAVVQEDSMMLPDIVSPVDEPDTIVEEPTELDMTIGEPLTLNVDSEEEGSTLIATASGKNVGEVPVSVTANESGNNYEVIFNPTEPDMYTVDVKMGGVHVPSSPFIINYTKPKEVEPKWVEPKEAEPKEEEPKEVEPQEVEPKEVEPQEVEPQEVEPKEVEPKEVEPKEVEPQEVEPQVVEPQEVEPQVVEPQEVEPKKLEPESQEEVPTHPITKPYLIRYIPEDGVDDLVAYAIHDETCTRNVLKIRTKKEGATHLVLNAEKTGLHFIHIQRDGKEVQGSPFKVEIVPSDPSTCLVLDIPERSFVGEETSLKVDASKAGAGDMHVVATVPVGGKGTQFSHVETQIGIFVIKFTPKVAGKHMLNIKWNGVLIPDSPVSVVAEDLTDELRKSREAATRVTVHDVKKVFSAVLDHSEGAHFFVVTDQAGQGQLSIRAKGPGNAKIDVIKQREFIYACRVRPIVSGKYHLEILWDGFPIPGHPYRLKFTNKKTYIINELNLETEKFVVGSVYEYNIDTNKQKGALEISANPSDCAQVDIYKLKQNIYTMKIAPQRVGNHEISVKFAGKHLFQSPYHVQFDASEEVEPEPEQDAESQDKLLRLSGIDFPIDLSGPTPETPPQLTPPTAPSASHPKQQQQEDAKVTAFGPGLQGGLIGQEGNFTIATDGCGDGKLAVTVHGPRGTFKAHLRHHPHLERTVLGRYDPTFIGEYTIDIQWNDQHIEKSPFVVNIKPQEAEALSG